VLVQLVLLDSLVPKVLLEQVAVLEQSDPLEHRVLRVQLVSLAHLDLLGHPDQVDSLERLDRLDIRALQELLEILAPRALRVAPETLARLDRLELTVNQDWLGRLVFQEQELLVLLGLQDRVETSGHLEEQVSRGWRDPKEAPDYQDPLDLQDQLDHPVQPDFQEMRDLEVRKVQLVLKDSPDQLER